MSNQIHPDQDDIHSQNDVDDDNLDELPSFQEKVVDVFHNEEEINAYPILSSILDNLFFQILVNLLTLYALFGDDIRIIAFDKTSDAAFDVITLLCLCVFSLEILMTSIAKPDYFNSFFFWLDIISTVSQILDLTMFNEAVGLIGSSSAKSASQLAQAGKASRTGSKAARVVRLVRLIRIVKLYKSANNRQEQQNISKIASLRKSRKTKATVFPTQEFQDDTQKCINFNEQEQQQQQQQQLQSNTMLKAQNPPQQQKQAKESRVSKRLSNSTTKKVVILVLLLLLLMPLFSADYYFDGSAGLDFATRYFKVVAEVPSSQLEDITNTLDFVINQYKDLDAPLGYVSTPFNAISPYQTSKYQNLRESSKGYYYLVFDPDLVGLPYTGDPILLFVSDRSIIDTNNSIISIVNTLFVCGVLLFGALTFAQDANTLALEPIERMIIKVNLIAQNPLIAKEMKLDTDNQQQETTQIENAIIKIGALLALGFGDAGSEIIATNMARSGDVDPMLPGRRKWAIYGFCDIRNFTDATEVLQKDVMLFVNNIAEIVHSMVDRYLGSANKNIGDAFLLVWKINDHEFNEEEGNIKWKNIQYINKLADCSLFAFMKIFAKINREPKILEYRQDERLSQRLPGYKVKMGFGLHIGWGIEGAIGSEFKIDASYLSPNVNMASRLEAATKQYGVALLISSDLQQFFSPQIQNYTRQVDKVTVKGSIRPIGLFTIDQEADDDLYPSKMDYLQEEKAEVLYDKRQLFKQLLDSEDFSSLDYFQRNKDLKLIMQHYNQEFQQCFHQGFQGYLLGNWKEAQMWFEKGKAIKANDGPTSTLISVMKDHGFKAPSDWQGFRELTEK